MRTGQIWTSDLFDWEVKITKIKDDEVHLCNADNPEFSYAESPMDREMFLRDFTLREN